MKATRLVGELADSVAYTHGLVEVAVEKGWWSRRICSRLTLAECVEETSADQVVEGSPELLEVMIDGSRPDYTAPTARTLLKYYVDSRKGSILFLGAHRPRLGWARGWGFNPPVRLDVQVGAVGSEEENATLAAVHIVLE